MIAFTPEQLRQRIGTTRLSGFLTMPPTEQIERLAGWRAEAQAKLNHAGPLVRLDARTRLKRCDEWSAVAELTSASGAF